jgi:S1-C subfamily serine protease
MVTGTSRGGKTEKAGLKPRDIILRCNGTRVRSLADFAKVLDQNPPRFKLDLLGGRTVRLPR